MRISIFGLGYVGAVSYGCLARDGHDVIGVDIDPAKLELLAGGTSPIVEEGMAELIAEAAASGRCRVTDSAADAVASSDLSLVCVGTPSVRSGAHDLGALRRVVQAIGEAVRDIDHHHTVVIRSTVAPGTVEGQLRPLLFEAAGQAAADRLALCFQPEFLREGSSIRDYDDPPMTVVAGDAAGIEQLRAVFGHLPCQFLETSINAAEALKFCCNAFHALKVTFANEVGRLCESLDVDGREVMHLLCQDTRLNVSAAYLRPGFAFGGSCLPKDLRALERMAIDQGVQVPMLAQVLESNAAHLDHAVRQVLDTGQRKVGLVGLSFKQGTDDLRESPLLELAERLIGKGIELQVHDPEVSMARLMGSNRAFVEQVIPHVSSLLTEDVEALVAHADVLVVGQRNAEVEAALAASGRRPVVIDLVDSPVARDHAAEYRGICW